MKQDDYCSLTCPYLKKVPETVERRLPFYCDLYRVFLGSENDNPCRCETCIGKSFNAKKDGYDFISSFPDSSVDKRKTKWGFRRLPLEAQDKFVRLVRQSGVLLGVDENTPLHTANVLRSLATQLETVGEPGPELKTADAEVFAGILDKLDADFPGLINDSTKDLLSNLFLSLDASEQDLMQSFLTNPERAESFIKEIEEMPKNDHMVKDLRRTLDEQKKQIEQEDRQREQENQRLIQLALQQQLERQRQEEERRRQEQERQRARAIREIAEKEAERQRQEQDRQQEELQKSAAEIELARQREEEERKKKEAEELRRQREDQNKEKDAVQTQMQKGAPEKSDNAQQMRTMQAIRAGMEGRG